MPQIGYDPDFLGNGLSVPFPQPAHPDLVADQFRRDTLRDHVYSDHINFSLMMQKSTRQLICSGCNIDQRKFRGKKGKGTWSFAEDIGAENQVPDVFYADTLDTFGNKVENPYDRGHMVMRQNNMQGATEAEANAAGRATYIFANASPQHKNLNQSEWVYLERFIVRPLKLDSNDRLCVFTGPIWGALDRDIRVSSRPDTARAPAGFFKVICFHMAEPVGNSALGVLTFAIYQDATVISEKKGGAVIKTDRKYQITVTELQDLTGLDFGKEIRDANPMIYYKKTARRRNASARHVPEHVPISRPEDVRLTLEETRRDEQPLEHRMVSLIAAMIRPTRPEQGAEWVSLYNRSETDLDLTGWVLRSKTGRRAVLHGTITAGAARRISGTELGTVRLGNDGGDLMLFDSNGSLVDFVTWTKEAIRRVGRGVAYQFERGQ